MKKMKKININLFKIFVAGYILCLTFFVGRVVYDNVKPISPLQRSKIPVLSKDKLDQSAVLLRERSLLNASGSASITQVDYGKVEPFSL